VDIRRPILWLLGASLILPIAIAILVGVARILQAMGDPGGAAVLDRIVLACGILWAIQLVVLLVVQGIALIVPPPRRPPRE
jgi:hypothetical protein